MLVSDLLEMLKRADPKAVVKTTEGMDITNVTEVSQFALDVTTLPVEPEMATRIGTIVYLSDQPVVPGLGDKVQCRCFDCLTKDKETEK